MLKIKRYMQICSNRMLVPLQSLILFVYPFLEFQQYEEYLPGNQEPWNLQYVKMQIKKNRHKKVKKLNNKT